MSSSKLAQQRILMVEDDPSNAMTLCALLEDLGYVVDLADCLAAARTLLLERRYAVVLLDHKLPDGTGVELLPLLRTPEPAIPAVLISGSQATDLEESSFAAIHEKGDDPEKLCKTLERLLKSA